MRKLYFLVFILFLSAEAYPQWVQTNGPYGGEVKCMAVLGTHIIAGSMGGVFISADNGTTWTRGDLVTDYPVTSLAVSGTILFAATSEHVFISTDSGASWKSADIGLPRGFIHVLTVSGSILFAGAQSGVFLSTNNGTSWQNISNGLPNEIDVRCLLVFGASLFAGTNGHGIFLSTNNGTSWSQINTGLTKFGVFSFSISGTNIFAGTHKGGVFLSTNNGTSWKEVSSGLPDAYVYDLAVYKSYIFAASAAPFPCSGECTGIFLSTDNGTSWMGANDGLQGDSLVYMSANSLVISGANLFAGIYGSCVWCRPLAEMVPVELVSFTLSTNGKEVTLSWTTATELNNQGFEVQRNFGGSDFVTIGSVKGHGTTTSPNQYLFVDKLIDGGKYFYRLKQIDFNGTFEYSNEIEVEVRVVDKFTLEQNYPNPFNPTTTIGYVLQEKSYAKLTLLNTIGEEIAVLVNEEQDRGYHKVEFDGSKLSSGVYFYQLKAGNYVETKKMILLR